MNITKLPSGSYRVRYSENGQRKSFTVDHKPTKMEALKLIMQRAPIVDFRHTFESACKAYISDKNNVLSPSTIRGYEGLIKQISPHLKATKLEHITLPMVQAEINSYSRDRSAKSAANMSGFIMGVLRYYGVDIKSPKVPQKEKKAPYIPTKEEVAVIYTEAKGSKYEVALLLAGMSLRRSEICALTPFDLKGNQLTINKAKVQGSGEKWHTKGTKTADSERVVILPDYIADLIRKNGCVYNGYPSAINQYLHRIQDKLGIQHFSLHKLRHFFASYMHDLGYSDKQIQEMGGWKTSNIMKTVYTHAMEIDEAKRSAASAIGNLIS